MKSRRAVILCFNAQPTPRQQNLFRLFREMGWRPAYVTWDRRCVPEQNTTQYKGEYLEVIHLAAPTESARLLFAMPQYWRRIRVVLSQMMREEETPPVIVATHFFHLRFARIFKQGLWLYDASEYFAFDLSRYFGVCAKLVRPALFYLEGRGVSRMRAVLAVDSRRGWFEKHLRRFCRSVRVIPNVPSLADDPPPELARIAGAEYVGRRVICYVGGIMERKGLLAAIDAVDLVRKDIPEILLLLIGPYRSDAGKLDELLSTRQLKDYVRIINQLPYRDMLIRMSGAEIGLALHQQDPLYERVGALNGRKIFTYMQAGLAIIGPKLGDIGRVVQEIECGVLIDAEDPADIAASLRVLLSNSKLRNQMQLNGRRAFEQHYNWETVVRELRPWLVECCKHLPSK